MDNNFYNWQWQLQHSIRNIKQLEAVLQLSDTEKLGLEQLARQTQALPFTITPYFLSLIDPNNLNDPLRMQMLPRAAEFLPDPIMQKRDPLGEEDLEVVPHLVHRYPDRVLLLITDRCASYCRFCTRKRWVGQGPTPKNENLEQALNYIKNNAQIKEVIISGGDPLMLSDARLEKILQKIRALQNIEIIRFHTRMLSFAPMRITEQLVEILKKYQPLYIVTHFNHPQEISELTAQSLTFLANNGIALLNQNVLLKGINDNVETLTALFRRLTYLRTRPYYLHQCDIAEGTHQFRVPLREALDLMKQLQGSLSGLCLPKFVIDIPGGLGKVPMTPNFAVQWDEKVVHLEGFSKKTALYPLY